MKLTTIWGIAGAGKTQFIAEILTGQKPFVYDDFSVDNTLLITFSRMATQVLQSRILSLAKNKSKQFRVSTFHSFIAQQAVRQKIPYRTLSLKEISSFFVSEGFPPIKARTILNIVDIFTFGHIYDCINKTKVMMLSPAEYYEKFQNRDEPLYYLSKDEYIRLYNKYQEFLRDVGAYDYTETLLLGFKLLLPQLKYIVIDEANDLCPLMMSLIHKWDPKVCILIGDPNQNIYDFAGSTEIYLSSVPPTVFIDVSHRCPTEIGNYALKFMEYGRSFRCVKEGGVVKQITEADIVDVIRQHKDKHVLLLPYRISTVEKLSLRFKAENIPHRVFGVLPFSPKLEEFIELIAEYHTNFENMQFKSLKFLKYLPSDLFGRKKTKILNMMKQLPNAKVSYYPEIVPVLRRLFVFPLTKLFELAKPTKEEMQDWLSIRTNPAEWYYTKLELMNIHKSKGYEADVVIFYYDIPPRHFLGADPGVIRRLVYTAITRAKEAFYYVIKTADYHVVSL
ncbi:MAG: AAA family ATPase [Archaeoglobaceae archaeon]